MKKYFTKYLPVEGEIEAGSLVTNTASHGSVLIATELHSNPNWDCVKADRPHWMCSNLLHQPESRGDIPVDQLKPVQLMLCTHDIQPGDKVQTESKGQAFKVVGMVSHAAVWVKESMEFTLSDIEQGGGCILYWNHLLSMWNKNKDDYFKYIQFRCPSCNTFH